MKFIINVGANRSYTQVKADPYKEDRLGYVSWVEVRAALRAAGFLVIQHETHIDLDNCSDAEEDTHIAVLDTRRIPPGEVFSRIWNVAHALHQDCIAVRVYDDYYTPAVVVHETLIGPDAAAWAPFNPKYFKELTC